MCGIAGIWCVGSKEISSQEFVHFIDTLAHRGPDGRGLYKDPNEPLYLGHRRLSILDLSERGDQPMSMGSQRFWITFNGEIYNFLEIRKELEELGHVFHSDSDTEVALASYIEWGEACQLKFNGMWAFAIWDAREKSLFLSRDRFGVKPLYYFWDGKRLGFASEVKAFTRFPDFEMKFDEQIVSNVLHDVNCIESTEYSLIQSVKRLQAGHSAFYKKGSHLSIHQWWQTLDHLPHVPEKWDGQVEQFRNLFLDACRLRLRSDVPTATALSGGLDSSSVLAGIAHVRQQSNNTDRMSEKWSQVFSAGFPNTSQDEHVFARQMVDHTKTVPFYCEIRADSIVKHLDQALYDLEEIFDLPIGPWLLYRHVREQGTVISIDGHGSDELLGGYHHHVETAIASASFPKLNPWRISEFRQILENMYPEGSPSSKASYRSLVKRAIVESLRKTPLAYHILRGCFRKMGFVDKGKQNWLRLSPETRQYTCDHPRFKDKDLFEQSLYLDFHQRTLPTILRNFDRCSMAHGVEIRAPFLDWRLVSYSFALDTNAKIGKGMTKRILREAMKGLLPENIRTRTAKVGFASPINEWLKNDLKPFVLDSMNSYSFQTSTIWDGPQMLHFAENAYRNGNLKEVRSCWEYVQADRLMTLFKMKSSLQHS